MNRAWLGGLSVIVGLIALIGFRAFFGSFPGRIPSLGALCVVGLCTGAFYTAWRTIARRILRLRAEKGLASEGRRLTSEGDELPRNAFLVAALSPCIACVTVAGVAVAALGVSSPEVWLLFAASCALSLRDVDAAAHVWGTDATRWIRETSRGLDFLKPVGET